MVISRSNVTTSLYHDTVINHQRSRIRLDHEITRKYDNALVLSSLSGHVSLAMNEFHPLTRQLFFRAISSNYLSSNYMEGFPTLCTDYLVLLIHGQYIS